MTRKGLVEIQTPYLAALIRGEMKIDGLPADATCVRAHYDIERDRLILLMLSDEFAPVQNGAPIPFYPLLASSTRNVDVKALE